MYHFWYLALQFEDVLLSFLLIKLVFECHIDFMLLLCWFDYYCCEIHASFIANVVFWNHLQSCCCFSLLFFLFFFSIIIMFNRDRSLIIRKLICYVLIRLSNVLLMSSDDFTLTINVFVLRSRLAKSEHHIIFQFHENHAIALTRVNRIFIHITHSQKLQILARQIVTLYVFQMTDCTFADITKSSIERLQWFVIVASTSTKTIRISFSLVATFSKTFRKHVKTVFSDTKRWNAISVSLYLFNFRFSTDLSDFMRKEFAIESDVSIFVTSNERFFDARRETRIFVKDRKNDQLMTDMSFSTRAFNRRRLMITLSLFQSLVTRDRFRNSGAAEKSSNKNVDVVENLSLFLFQNENDNDFLSEQHDNYDDFDSNIEVERLSEFSNVVSIAKRTESTIFSVVNFSETHEIWISTSRQRRVVKKTSLSWKNRYEESFRTYATQMRIILNEITKNEKKSENESEMKNLK